MDMQNWPKSDWENVYYGLKEISRKMEKVMFECVDDEKARQFAQDCVDGIDTWLENCKRKGHIEVHTLDLTSSRKPIKSDYHNKEIYREAFASLVKDSDAQDFDNGDYGIAHYPGFYRILVDGTYETEFSAETDEEAIQKFKDYFANKKKGINNSKKPIKSVNKHFNYDEYLGDIYDLDRSNADNWSREEYNEMVETARGIFYPAVQKAANACRFTVSDNEAEYVAEKCVRCFFDNTSWDEAVNRPEKYYVNSSRKPIKSSLEDRLIPYLEEFEEGYANAITRDSEDASEFNHVYEDTFFEQFKSDYNLTDTDIQKLDKAVREIWDANSTDPNEVRDMGEMYGAPRGATSEEALKHFE